MVGKVEMGRLILVGISCLWVIVSCTPNNLDHAENRIIYGLTLIPSGIDPHIHSSSELGIVLRQVYDTLVYRDPDTLEFVPGLAASWDISSDGLIYTFYLRPDVKFHDDTPFDASAVAANLDRITNPEVVSQRALYMLGPYDRYVIIDSYTIQIHLRESYAPLLDSLAQVYLGMASPAALAEFSRNRYQFHQVGTGPYRFVEYLPGDRIIIERNPDYNWGPSFYTKTADDPDIVSIIEFRFYTDEATRRIALENGEVHIMGELLPSDARSLSVNSQFQLIPTSIPGQPAQFLVNTALFPTNDPLVRQSLLLSLNRNAITDAVFQGFSPIAWGPIASNTAFYNPQMVNQFTYNVTQARELLSDAGYEDTDGNGFLDGANGELEVIVIVPNWGLLPQVAQIMEDQWQQLGIRVRLEPVPGFNALLDRVNTQPYNLVAFNTPGIDPALLNNYFMTGGSRNWTNYSNIQLDNTLQAASATVDPLVRQNLYRQIQEFLLSEVLLIPIREYVNLNAAAASVQGLKYDAYGWFPILNDVTLLES